MSNEYSPWKILGNPTRLRIIELLEEKARTTSELCAFFDLSRFGVMQHLRVLEQAGVVIPERQGRFRWNHLDLARLSELRLMLNSVGPRQAAAPGRPQDQPVGDPAHIQFTVSLAAPPAQVFAALSLYIGDWWQDDGSAVSMEPVLGGRFMEQFAIDGSGIVYATVDKWRPDELLGLFGPMGTDTTVSIIRFYLLEEEQAQTRLTLHHRFVGDVDQQTLEAFRLSWENLLGQRLPAFLTT